MQLCRKKISRQIFTRQFYLKQNISRLKNLKNKLHVRFEPPRHIRYSRLTGPRTVKKIELNIKQSNTKRRCNIRPLSSYIIGRNLLGRKKENIQSRSKKKDL